MATATPAPGRPLGFSSTAWARGSIHPRGQSASLCCRWTSVRSFLGPRELSAADSVMNSLFDPVTTTIIICKSSRIFQLYRKREAGPQPLAAAGQSSCPLYSGITQGLAPAGSQQRWGREAAGCWGEELQPGACSWTRAEPTARPGGGPVALAQSLLQAPGCACCPE